MTRLKTIASTDILATSQQGKRWCLREGAVRAALKTVQSDILAVADLSLLEIHYRDTTTTHCVTQGTT